MWKRPYPQAPQTPTAPPQAVILLGGSPTKAVPGGTWGHRSPPLPTCSVLVAELQPEASGGLGTVAAGLGRWDSAGPDVSSPSFSCWQEQEAARCGLCCWSSHKPLC